MQGEVTGPGQCSNQVDTLGKECLEDDKHLYEYKGGLGVSPLGMVDDVVAVSKCGLESVEMNAYLNQKTSIKKLQFGPDKCHQLHVGKANVCCPDLYIDEWKLEKKDKLKTGVENLVDILVDQHKIENVTQEKYLGDIITTDGKNTKNIEAREAKAQGIIKQIKTILEEMVFGNFIFEVGVILRNSLFINGILTNIEAAYGLTSAEIEKLEKCDEQLMRAVLETPCTTPREMLYLELGVVPIRYIVMSRRLMFYHYILNQENDSLLYKFFKLQKSKSVRGDWCLTVQEDLESLNITLTEDEIEKCSEFSFKKIVNTAIRKEAFSYLLTLKNSHSKVKHISYETHKMQEYLMSPNITADLAKFTFMCRSRMVAVGANYKQGVDNPVCPVCKVETEFDTQKHLMLCTRLNQNLVTSENLPDYLDLFKSDVEKQVTVAKLLKENLKKRTKILEKKETSAIQLP